MWGVVGDVGRKVRSKEHGNVSNVVRGAAAAKRNLLLPFFTYAVGQGFRHGCLDEARGDGVGADAFRPHLLGYGLGQGDHSGFRGGIVGLAGVAVDAHDGGHIDDAAAATTHHHGYTGVDKVEG